jgi:hypothetical protein
VSRGFKTTEKSSDPSKPATSGTQHKLAGRWNTKKEIHPGAGHLQRSKWERTFMEPRNSSPAGEQEPYWRP